MSAYYNEHDPNAAAWLHELIKAGHIAPGEVDERSIIEVDPSDVRGFKQCHFFAGIGGWSYALRLAGWPDDRPVWTGSPPCQPFSAAGKQQGTKDERHLWPALSKLIAECRPQTLFGEQVASAEVVGSKLEADFAVAVFNKEYAKANKLANKLVKQKSLHYPARWLDALQDDLESQGYACGAVVLPACSVGAPHIRQRLWFVADDTQRGRRQERANRGRQRARDEAHGRPSARLEPSRDAGELAESKSEQHNRSGNEGRRRRELADGGSVGNPSGEGLQACNNEDLREQGRREEGRDVISAGADTNPWAGLEWLQCADGKARPTKPGIFPLSDGVSGRVGLLRGAGNAIVPQVAAQVIGAYMEL